MTDVDRKMATIRVVTGIKPIEGADRIELALIDGWQVVVQKDQFKEGDKVIYFEIDSWVPHKIAPFLTRGTKPKEYNGVEGNRLKTVKLKGTLSQGLVLPVKETLEIDHEVPECFVPEDGADVTDLLNIQKYEKPIPAQLAGMMRGNFPSFVPKTHQERIQNYWKTLDTVDLQQEWMITEKLDGTSMTVYLRDGVFGVCSRNIDLKEDETNSFWKAAKKYGLQYVLEKILVDTGTEVAIQGELVGPGIQGNPYNLKEQEFYVFNVFNITENCYLDPRSATWLMEEKHQLPFVPVIGIATLPKFLETLLSAADGPSMLADGVDREGIVLHRRDGWNSFKVISNNWLLKNE